MNREPSWVARKNCASSENRKSKVFSIREIFYLYTLGIRTSKIPINFLYKNNRPSEIIISIYKKYKLYNKNSLINKKKFQN